MSKRAYVIGSGVLVEGSSLHIGFLNFHFTEGETGFREVKTLSQRWFSG